MANVIRIRTTWTGSPVVGPGVSTFYWEEADTGFVAKLNTFWTSLAGTIESGIALQTLNSGDLIDIPTGTLTGTWTDGGTSNVNTSSTGNYAAGVGARIKWQTSGVRNGRRVQGATFLVPLPVSAYDATGTLAPTTLTNITNAANALVLASAGKMRIYSRPSSTGAGVASAVVGASVLDTVSWLRSRRT